jgi:hypothetical protein
VEPRWGLQVKYEHYCRELRPLAIAGSASRLGLGICG